MGESKVAQLKELIKKGDEYRTSREYKKAIEYYTRAIEIDSGNKLIYYNRGLSYSELEKLEKAIDDFTEAIKIDTNYVAAYIIRGIIYYYQGEYEEAIKDYDKVMEINPNHADAYNNRGITFYYQGKYGKAMEDYGKAIEINPNHALAYNNRGVIYDQKGEYEKAIKDYTKAIEINGNLVKPYRNRKIVYQRINNKQEEKNNEDMLKIINIKLNYEKFYQYIEKNESDIIKKIQIFDLYLNVMKLKDKLLYREYRSVGHYTKISNLKHLFKPDIEEKNNNSRLRLNNVAYMNDPTEGEVFFELLNQFCKCKVKDVLDIVYKNKNENNDRGVLNGKNHVFLASFSSALDRLPMWVQYSDNGNGCCIVFDQAFFDKEDKNPLSHILSEKSSNLCDEPYKDIDNEKEKITYYCLYNVKYIDNNNGKYDLKDREIAELIQEIGEKLIFFEEDLKSNSYSIIKDIIQNILDQVRFLFKDKSYDHEEEVRLIKFEDNGNVKYTGDAEGFIVPHVYIDVDRKLNKDTVDEVILGPKVENAAELANYLYYTDKVNMVTKSKIKYK